MVRIKLHREISQDHIIKSCMISMTPTGKCYVSISTEYEKEVETVVGIRLCDGLIIRQF